MSLVDDTATPEREPASGTSNRDARNETDPSRLDDGDAAKARTSQRVYTPVATRDSALATPLRAVLVGEHPARALDWLLTRARSDPAGHPVLDMSLEEAQSLVACADAWCDWLDETRHMDRQRREERDG